MKESRKQHRAEAPPVLFLREFRPFSALWEGDKAPYPSEASARWAVRRMKPELAEAQALALHRGCLLVHMQRFAAVAEGHAIAAAVKRAAAVES